MHCLLVVALQKKNDKFCRAMGVMKNQPTMERV